MSTFLEIRDAGYKLTKTFLLEDIKIHQIPVSKNQSQHTMLQVTMTISNLSVGILSFTSEILDFLFTQK